MFEGVHGKTTVKKCTNMRANKSRPKVPNAILHAWITDPHTYLPKIKNGVERMNADSISAIFGAINPQVHADAFNSH
jgi:hypothetical protein